MLAPAPAWMPVRAPGRVSAEDNGRPKAEGKKLLFDNILQDFFRPTNGFVIFRPSSFNIKRQTFLPGERNEHPFRDVFFELAHGLSNACKYTHAHGTRMRTFSKKNFSILGKVTRSGDRKQGIFLVRPYDFSKVCLIDKILSLLHFW